MMIDAFKAAKVEFAIFMSVYDPKAFDSKTYHIHAKLAVENYLKKSGLKYAILRPCAFFENFDDPANHNPLVKGHVKFLFTAKTKYCSTLDIGINMIKNYCSRLFSIL